MSYQNERDQFIDRMAKEGLPLHVTTSLLRGATTIQRYAELSCSSEAADRDRVMCPSGDPRQPAPGIPRTLKQKQAACLCDYDEKQHRHTTIPRITLQGYRLENRLIGLMPEGWTLRTEGDPRGYTLAVIPPSYAERNAGRDRFNQDAIGVPSGPTRLRF